MELNENENPQGREGAKKHLGQTLNKMKIEFQNNCKK